MKMRVRFYRRLAPCIVIGLSFGFMAFRCFGHHSWLWATLAAVGGIAVVTLIIPIDRREIAIDGDDLILDDGTTTTRLASRDLMSYRISSFSSLGLSLYLRDGSEVQFSLEYVGSLRRVRRLFARLGITQRRNSSPDTCDTNTTEKSEQGIPPNRL